MIGIWQGFGGGLPPPQDNTLVAFVGNSRGSSLLGGIYEIEIGIFRYGSVNRQDGSVVQIPYGSLWTTLPKLVWSGERLQEYDAVALQVGRDMIAMTTTVQGVEEWPAIPALWKACLDERNELRRRDNRHLTFTTDQVMSIWEKTFRRSKETNGRDWAVVFLRAVFAFAADEP